MAGYGINDKLSIKSCFLIKSIAPNMPRLISSKRSRTVGPWRLTTSLSWAFPLITAAKHFIIRFGSDDKSWKPNGSRSEASSDIDSFRSNSLLQVQADSSWKASKRIPALLTRSKMMAISSLLSNSITSKFNWNSWKRLCNSTTLSFCSGESLLVISKKRVVSNMALKGKYLLLSESGSNIDTNWSSRAPSGACKSK